MLQQEKHSKGFWIRWEEIYPYRVETLSGSSSLGACVAGVFLPTHSLLNLANSLAKHFPQRVGRW